MEKRCKWCIVYISMYLYGFVHKELPYISLCFWFLPLECRCRGCLHGVVTWCQSGLTSSDEVRRDCSLSHQNSSGSNLSAIIVMPLSGNSINISLIPKPSCFFFPLFCFREHEQKRLGGEATSTFPFNCTLISGTWRRVPRAYGKKLTVSFTPLCLKHTVGKCPLRVQFVWHLTGWCLWIMYEPRPYWKVNIAHNDEVMWHE